MREIVFRGKQVDTGEWIMGGLVHSMYHKGDTCIKGPRGVFDVLHETVGQYIGIRDKDGAKIFEGDILRFSKADELCVVEWSENEEQLVGHTYFKGINTVQYLHECYFEEMVIVGNVHDDPELLK